MEGCGQLALKSEIIWCVLVLKRYTKMVIQTDKKRNMDRPRAIVKERKREIQTKHILAHVH